MFGFQKDGRGVSKKEAASRNYFDHYAKRLWILASSSKILMC